jgi:hypothetical protein
VPRGIGSPLCEKFLLTNSGVVAMSEPRGANTVGERLARLEAMMIDTRDDVKNILSEMREWSARVDERATNKRVDGVETRLATVERKAWYASGVAGVLSFLAGMFGKDFLSGR